MKIRNGILYDVRNKDIKNGTFVIPNSVTSIESYAFTDCSNLTFITIPNSVTSIESYAFSRCRNLTFITIPDSVTRIESYAFYGCSNLKTITIPDSVTRIESYAFYGCSNLKTITIPDSVTTISFGAFYECNSLKSKLGNYKAFNYDMTCRSKKYKLGRTKKHKGKIELCESGLHYVTNLFDIFNYYNGELNEDIIICEVKVNKVSKEKEEDSKRVCAEITPIRALSNQEIIDILNNKEE